ncbi:hypothetical protein N7520_006731 [Penicillium odoratum]|uniref:uncharacterized protein n=1 Tax=Penicillium odoratum TaxID=1167516 RepID=UPI002546CE2D|nr:uncharacterized protein N7520_006731 [Penicillium odoratum]KAJ5759575.1 hypothetical protein N7520_006731 [Penicillium odoratum]
MLRFISLHLLFFIESLQLLQLHIDHGQFHAQPASMLQMIIDECYSQMILLDDLVTKVTPVEGDSKMVRSCKALESLKHEKAMEKIVTRVSNYIEKLPLFQSAVTAGGVMANARLARKQLEYSAHMKAVGNAVPSGSGIAILAENTPSRISRNLAYHKQYRKRQFSYFMGLSRFGLFWAFQVALDISWGNYGFSISPSLRFQQLVKNTSPGFQNFYKCRMHQSDIQSSCDKLLQLFCSGKASLWDTFPDGTTWIEVC